MKKVSIKGKVVLWLTVMMALLSGLLLLFMLSVSTRVITGTSMEQLSETVRHNAAEVSFSGDELQLGENFQFYHSGVSTLVYSQSGTLLAGQPPMYAPTDADFDSGELRTIPIEDSRYLLLDFWVPNGWENGVWVRGLLEAPEHSRAAHNMLWVAAIAMPLFLVLAAVGGYLILRRTFRPLDTITDTAEAIGEAKDLSLRIGLPPGKDEFSRLAETFDRLFDRLERSFEAERQFTADASHELRSPVSVIKGACEYGLKYDETAEERRETLDMIHRQSVKMSELISRMLTMTRLEQGTELPDMKEVDVCALTAEIAAEYPHFGSRLQTDLKDSIIVRGDPALLSRLLRNLIDNAFKYGKPEGHVWVSVEKTHSEVLLRVRDDGIGISTEQQDKVWQRFYQVDASRNEETGGAGLGLAMVEQIARLHGGYMTLESVPKVGSTFTLHLPLAEKIKH